MRTVELSKFPSRSSMAIFFARVVLQCVFLVLQTDEFSPYLRRA
jgi:hypothetical protein